jgi:hypothetical protein
MYSLPMPTLNESTFEVAALAWLESLGYAVLHGPDIAPNKLREKSAHRQTVNNGATT